MHVVTDDERREVAERLRHSWTNVADKNPVRHQLRVLFEIYSAVGLADDDDADAVDLFARLADLIYPGDTSQSCRDTVACGRDAPGHEHTQRSEPSEPKVKCVAEVKVDGERLEQLVHDAAVELTGVDRDALLALADKMKRYARLRSSSGMDVDAMAVGAWVNRIREACGEVVE